MKKSLNVILLSSAFNGLTQRAWLALQELGHSISVIVFTTPEEVTATIQEAQPDIVICPFLKDKVPEVLWKNQEIPVVIIHPGIMGDRGASALDWTIMNQLDVWGVTALQAVEEMDAGPIWASHEFKVPKPIRKSALYNSLVSDAAMLCIFETIEKFISGEKPTPLDYNNPKVKGQLQPNMKQINRHFEWTMPAKDILNIINTADGVPGVLTEIEGESFHVFDAFLCEQQGEPGKLMARSEDAVLIGTGDKSLWIGSLKRPIKGQTTFKCPSVQVLKEKAANLKDLTVSLHQRILSENEYSTIHYAQKGSVGELTFEFYNGAMSTEQCARMCEALRFAKAQDTSVLVIKGGWNAFSNGIHLNTIEAAENPGQEAWLNIQAIDDVCLEILEAEQWIIAGVTGSSGAGGVMLALTADQVLAREGVVLNPHYATMGLYGSEYWTYTLPKRVGEKEALRLTTECLPISTKGALDLGVIEGIGPREPKQFSVWLSEQAQQAAKQNRKKDKKPYDAEKAQKCRENELKEMKEDLLNDRQGFSQKRQNFVFKKPTCKTPERLIAEWTKEKNLIV